MAIRNPADLKELADSGRRLMALDLGAKTIGLALSDTRMILSGALPAALLALTVDGLLGLCEAMVKPAFGGLTPRRRSG